MAPTKQKETLAPLQRKPVGTRSKATTTNQNHDPEETLQRCKRKVAEVSPHKNDRLAKRSALGNLTNAVAPNAELDTDTITNHPKNVRFSNHNGTTATNGPTATKLHTISSNIGNNKKNAISKPVFQTEIFAKPDPDGPKVRGATKILTRAASRQISAGKTLSTSRSTVENSIGHSLKGQISAMTAAIVKTKELTFDGVKLVHLATGNAAQQCKGKRRISNEFEKTDDSLYVSALEDITSSGSVRLSDNFGDPSSRSDTPTDQPKGRYGKSGKEEPPSPRKKTPDGVEDYDLTNWDDVFQVSHYAHEIFTYQKEREALFVIPDYMSKQPYISKWMRALLVDWMVEIQESFELNHETLYLAVKIVDIYLSRKEIQKDSLQLLGAAALMISSKFDERVPPALDDFHYICDGAYERRDMILMERNVFKIIGMDLGIPLSYRFLRRYARVNRIEMPVLTLARFILEFCLMEYSTVQLRDSKMACAALFIAMRMTGMPGWNKTLEYYSGYKIEDFAEIAILLNNIMSRKPKESLNTVRHKYSHELFYETAKKPFITDLSKLFETTDYDPLADRSKITASSITTVASVTTRSHSKP